MLSKKSIDEHVRFGSIVCAPYRRENLNPASLDVTIGNYIISVNSSEREAQALDMDGANFFIEGLRLTVSFVQTGEMVRIPARGRIIAHTDEFVGSLGSINTKMHAKSTVGRYGIEVCSCAGLGDPGFYSRWAMEIYNKNESPVHIKIGARIAQLSFYMLDPPVSSADLYHVSGSYQQSSDIREIINKWTWRSLIPPRMIADSVIDVDSSVFQNVIDDTRSEILNGFARQW